jgi:hypothetical protein
MSLGDDSLRTIGSPADPMPRRRGRFRRAMIKLPFTDATGRKGRFERFSRAQPHVVRHVMIGIEGWPHMVRPLRVAFLSDLHSGSHRGDVERLRDIILEAGAFAPDVALFGGDYVNMQVFGGGRIPPATIADLLGLVQAPHGRFAVLGNHDYDYGSGEVARALRARGIDVIDHDRRTLTIAGHAIDIIGLPDARNITDAGRKLLSDVSSSRPTIILAHDPAWFATVPRGPHLTVSGHTHGGQIALPGVGAIVNSSAAPLRWSRGHIIEDGRHLYVSAGLGTSGIPLRIGVPPEYAVIDITGP